MTPENIAQWVIDNRYPKSEQEKVSDHEMYHFILSEIALFLNKEKSHEGQMKLCSNCKYLHNTEGEEPCKTCLNHAEYINHEWE